MRKFQMTTPKDYIAFLHGRILFAADDADRYDDAEKYLQGVHAAEELEDYLGQLLDVVEDKEV